MHPIVSLVKSYASRLAVDSRAPHDTCMPTCILAVRCSRARACIRRYASRLIVDLAFVLEAQVLIS